VSPLSTAQTVDETSPDNGRVSGYAVGRTSYPRVSIRSSLENRFVALGVDGEIVPLADLCCISLLDRFIQVIHNI